MIKTSALDTINNAYQDGDANVNLKGSQLPADNWNMIQGELCNAAQVVGVPLDKGNHHQVADAVIGVAKDVYGKKPFSKSTGKKTIDRNSSNIGLVVDIPVDSIIDLDVVFDVTGVYSGAGDFVQLNAVLAYGSSTTFIPMTQTKSATGVTRHRFTHFFASSAQGGNAATLTFSVRTSYSTDNGAVDVALGIDGYVENSR